MIVVLTGMPCSGKGEAGLVAEAMGAASYDTSFALKEELRQNGKELNAVNLQALGKEWREKHGRDAVTKKGFPYIRSAIEGKKNVVVMGIRSFEEYESLKREFKDATLVAAVAPRQKRFENAKAVARYGVTDEVAFDIRDKKDLDLGVGACICLADEYLINDCPLPEFKERARMMFQRVFDKAANPYDY